MKRYFLLLVSLLFVSALVVGCSSNDASSDTNASTDDTNSETEESASEDSSGGGDDLESLGIELRSHDYDEAEEDVDDFTDWEDGNYAKHGENLTLPEEFPDDFPVAEGMSVDSVIVNESSLEVWFNDGGKYTIEQMYGLYDHYIHSTGFDEAEVKDYNTYMKGLYSYNGVRDGLEYYIGVHPESNYNVVTLALYKE